MPCRTFTIPIGFAGLTLTLSAIGGGSVGAQAHLDHRGEIAVGSFSVAESARLEMANSQAQRNASAKPPPAARSTDKPRPNYSLVHAWPSKADEEPEPKHRLSGKLRKPEPLMVPAVQRVRDAPYRIRQPATRSRRSG